MEIGTINCIIYLTMTSKNPLSREYFASLKAPKDTMTAEKLNAMKPIDQLETLRDRVGHRFNNRSKKQDRDIQEASPYAEEHLAKYIDEARARLKLDDDEYLIVEDEDAFEAESWLIDRVGDKDGYKLSDKEYTLQIIEVVKSICDQCNVPLGWYEYFVGYIALKRPPEYSKVFREYLVTVDSINDDAVTITLHKGIDHDDFEGTWKALSPFLKQPAKPTPYGLKDSMRRDRDAGMSNNAIAKKYYPEQFQSDPTSTMDRVRKMFSRLK